MKNRPTYQELEKRIKVLEKAESSRQKIKDRLERRVSHLTLPIDGIEILKFEDLFNLEDIQRLQDEFASATGVASIITNTDGTPITAASNFCRLCKDIIRTTRKGLLNCFKSDAVIGRYNPDGPIIQPCESGGLWDAGAAITIGGKHIASWLIGQVRNDQQTEAGMREYARKIGVDENSMLEAFQQVPTMSRDQFERIARMLFTLANQLSTLAYQNIQQARFINESKKNKENLVKNEEKFRDLVESSIDLIWEVDHKGFYTYLSPKLEGILGYKPSEVIGKSRFDLMSRNEAERVRKLYFTAVEKKIPLLSLVTENLHKDGHPVVLETSGVPIMDHGGNLRGYRGVDRDITLRREIEMKLKRREETLNSIFLAAPTGIGMVVDRKITWMNQRFCDTVGYTADELLGKGSDILYPDRETFEWVGREKYDQIARTGTGTVETRWRRKDGEIIDVLLSSTPLDQSDWSKGVTFTSLDISEKKRADLKLLEYRDHLETMVEKRTAEIEAKNKELETFTYSVSHDLKAPLRGIDGYSRLLMENYTDKLDEEGLLFLKNIRLSAAQMNQLIEDLLAYSRMERRQLQPVLVELLPMIDMMISQRTRDIEAGSINISVSLPFQTITSDIETLKQVLGNYIDNAVKFSKKEMPATVEVGGSENETSWTLWVKDNGIGFDAKYHDRIFNIFQRLHRAEDYPGTGVGLAIARKAVERIGGRVWAKSVEGKGATFFITILKQ